MWILERLRRYRGRSLPRLWNRRKVQTFAECLFVFRRRRLGRRRVLFLLERVQHLAPLEFVADAAASDLESGITAGPSFKEQRLPKYTFWVPLSSRPRIKSTIFLV